MKILYICSLFCQKNSSAAIRNMSLVSGLIENGHKVKVVTLKVESDYENKLYKELGCELDILGEQTSKNKISGYKNILKNSKLFSFVFKFIGPFYFFPDTHKRFIDIFKPENYLDYDYIISSSDTKSSHFAAAKLKDKSPKIKWIQVWGDPWYEDVTINKITKSKVKKKELNILESANSIVYISKLTLDLIKNKYPFLSDKMYYIPRSYFREVNNTYIKSTNFRFIYTGVINSGRNMEVFFNWFSNLNKISAFIDIYGFASDQIKGELKSNNKINFKGVLSYENILLEYEKSDVLVLMGNKKDSTQIPGKLYDYLGTNLPIICVMYSKDEGVSKLLCEFPQCYVVTYDELLNNDIDEIKLYSFLKNRFLPIKRFSSGNVALEIEEILFK